MKRTLSHCLILLAALSLGAGPAVAKTTDPKLTDVQKQARELEKTIEQDKARQEELKSKAANLKSEIDKLQTEMVETAKNTQEQEEALSTLESSLKNLNQSQEKATKNLLSNHESLSRILAAVLRLKRQPPQALLIVPQTPLDTAHTVVLLKDLIPQVDAETQKLRQELDEISALQNAIGDKKQEAEQRRQKLKQERAKLEGLVKRRLAAHSATEQEQKKLEAHIDKLAAQAADLRDLLQKLETERKARLAKAKSKPKPKSAKEVASLAGMTLPVKGKILTNYGEKNDVGVTSKGITIETRPGAQVISPAKGEVVFAGNFRSYGLILIIEYGDGYHIMLSNLGRIDCALGQELVAGEPVGVMGGNDGAENAKTSAPRLYVEFRSNGQPVPPQSWSAPRS